MPGTTKEAIYFLHKESDGNEVAASMIGFCATRGSRVAGDYSGTSEPSSGIPLGEVFSYRIKAVGNALYVDIYRDCSPDVTEIYPIGSSGYASN